MHGLISKRFDIFKMCINFGIRKVSFHKAKEALMAYMPILLHLGGKKFPVINLPLLATSSIQYEIREYIVQSLVSIGRLHTKTTAPYGLVRQVSVRSVLHAL
jgi:hypothetical protein